MWYAKPPVPKGWEVFEKKLEPSQMKTQTPAGVSIRAYVQGYFVAGEHQGWYAMPQLMNQHGEGPNDDRQCEQRKDKEEGA